MCANDDSNDAKTLPVCAAAYATEKTLNMLVCASYRPTIVTITGTS